ncbi:hypothetical protein [Streptomyces sp. NBC_01571]|uniref:hypothetical protein n=1 Tax=unclassified Streptomyces TaxID=2593676 RepID=UPI0022541242|nr:hypothetical protein [Streptomyces sp. NBC_01571]MCX4577598.1 hypothetical protein [Streptomyces sp. NBC_01571]
MPADEATRGTEADESRVRTGPRHAAPRKPLFTRFHVPAGKAVAIAAMPTAVLMGMGFTPTLAQADDHSSSKSLTADEYKKCVEAMTGSTDGKDASAEPTPSASSSASSTASPGTTKPTPSASASPDKTSSSDSGSDDKAGSDPTPSASKPAQSSSGSGTSGDGKTATTPSASANGGGLLGTIGDAITGVLTGGSDSTGDSTPAPSATPSASASASATGSTTDKGASGTLKDTTDKVTGTVEKAVKDTTDTATKAAEDTTKAVKDAADAATSSPSPSASSTTDPSDCPVATDAEGGVDNSVLLPDDPWYLNASSLLLKGADYQGVVKVKTAGGKIKRVLKYVISDGTDIGDLHQTVNDEQAGKTYHVQAGKGTTSTIRDGKTVMYTESISGNLLGLIPITFDPDNPPPLNIPLIYFTKVKVVQAGQFGGTLTVPGLHQYTS